MRNVMKAATLESKFPILSVEHDCIISKDADITVCYRVELPELFTVTQAEYEAIHSAWAKAVKVLPNTVSCLGDVRLPLSALTEQVITDYNAFLVQLGLVRNSVSFYMSVLRAIYNKAVRQKLIVRQHPFTEVYTGIDCTRKRAVSESIIAQLHPFGIRGWNSARLVP